MAYALFVVYESVELGPTPICRISDPSLTKMVVESALSRAIAQAGAMRLVDEDACSDAFFEVDKLRSIVATI